MGLTEFVRLTARHAVLIVVCTLVSILAGTALYFSAPRVYEGEAAGQIVSRPLSDEQAGNSVNQAYADMLVARARAASFAALMRTGQVYDRASQITGGRLTAVQIRDNTRLDLPKDSTTIWVRTRANDPQLASEAAVAVVEATSREVFALEGKDTPYFLRPIGSAYHPQAPVSPIYVLYFLPALALGLVAGYFLALARDAYDRKIRGEADLAQLPGAISLGSVPIPATEDEDNDAGFLNFVDAQDLVSQQSIRKIRTNLEYSQVDYTLGSLTITSSFKGEGKSTFAINLALAFARAGQAVVLVDADLRRPSLAGKLGVDTALGLAQVLAGEVLAADALAETAVAQLKVLAAGAVSGNPSQMLGSQRMEELVDQLSREYFVICDAPPVLAVIDPVVLSRVTDGVVVVARAGRTWLPQLRRTLESLQKVQARVVGCVVTATKRQRGRRLFQSSQTSW